MANNQYLADLNIWRHQRYTEPPALATSEGKGFRALQRWAAQFYPAEEAATARGTRVGSPSCLPIQQSKPRPNPPLQKVAEHFLENSIVVAGHHMMRTRNRRELRVWHQIQETNRIFDAEHIGLAATHQQRRQPQAARRCT
jgi:hypothetical protein